jgi:DNA repair exonuclease SbcCD ATPase subunit
MRYKFIELHNYAGIYNGMGLTQIKIDFTKCVTNKVIIRGSNGSGKSTLMSAINPNPDSNDKFIPGAEARKIIGLFDNGTDYIIRYIHPVNNSGVRATTKGYISKGVNGQMVELNPNGNISSCKDILYNEFNLDSNYLSLSRLTSEDRGLVDSRPADRKKLVNSIIHTLETYNNIYKILSKKSSLYKATIVSITSKIDYIGNPMTLKMNLDGISKRLKSFEAERDKTIETIASVKLRINDYLKILKDNDYTSLVEDLKTADALIGSLENTILRELESLNISRDQIENVLQQVYKQMIQLDSEINNLREQIPGLLARREAEAEDLQKKQTRLQSLKSEYNYVNIQEVTDNARAEVAQYNETFKAMGLTHVDLITKSEFDTAMESLQYLKSAVDVLTSSFYIDDIKYVVNNYREVKTDITNIKSLNDALEKIQKTKSDLERAEAIYISKREIAAELKNRPSKCKIDTCPYIAQAVIADKEYPESKLVEIGKNIQECADEISEIKATLEKLNTYSSIISQIDSITMKLDSSIKFIKKLPVRKDFKESFFQRVIDLDRFDDINALYKYVDCGNIIEQYKIATTQLQKYEAEYEIYKSKNEVIDSIITDIKSLMTKTDELDRQITTVNNSIQEKSSLYSQAKALYDRLSAINTKIIDVLNPEKEKRDKLIETKSKLDGDSQELTELNGTLEALNKDLGAINNDIEIASKEKENITHSLSMLAEYNEELKIYNDKYSKIEKIRYYSSSSTGIQTIYMQLYMNNILATANQLLSLLFEGEFMLQPFVINENEFRIPCLGSGLLHDDISSMSTAQKCMISMILSFSILHQSATKYNIIFLDELDGGLDSSNRSYFITLLDKLMGILRCEQCFIISHNNELTAELADLIILKNNTNEQYNGNVIWKY